MLSLSALRASCRGMIIQRILTTSSSHFSLIQSRHYGITSKVFTLRSRVLKIKKSVLTDMWHFTTSRTRLCVTKRRGLESGKREGGQRVKPSVQERQV